MAKQKIYAPLTPKLRKKLNNAIDELAAELKLLEDSNSRLPEWNTYSSSIVTIWLLKLAMVKKALRIIPDYYPIPIQWGED